MIRSPRRRTGAFLFPWLLRSREAAHARAGDETLVREAPREEEDGNFRQMAFTFAVIALAAKLSHSDGKVKKAEFLAFCTLFPLPHEERTKVHKLFLMACRDRADAGHYARQIVQLFPGRDALMIDLIERLCRIALADGPAVAAEREWLEAVARVLGVAKRNVTETLGEEMPAPQESADPFRILGIAAKASPEEIKRAYRRRIREFHPDLLASRGAAPEEVAAAQAALARINAAYASLVKKTRVK